jgi:hypothetical protein
MALLRRMEKDLVVVECFRIGTISEDDLLHRAEL